MSCIWQHTQWKYHTASGVTRVGDTRGATEGVTPLFFVLKNLATFFAHRCHYHYCFLLLSLGCHPLQGFYLSDLVSPLFFVNVLTKKFFSFGCHPLDGVTQGGPPLWPPSDATDLYVSNEILYLLLKTLHHVLATVIDELSSTRVNERAITGILLMRQTVKPNQQKTCDV